MSYPTPGGIPPVLDTVRCAGCGRCVAACSRHLISLEVAGFRKHACLSSPERCSGCLACVEACPAGALRPD